MPLDRTIDQSPPLAVVDGDAPPPRVTAEQVMDIAEQMAAASKAIFADLSRIDREQLGSAFRGDDGLCEALDDIRDYLQTAIDYITGDDDPDE